MWPPLAARKAGKDSIGQSALGSPCWFRTVTAYPLELREESSAPALKGSRPPTGTKVRFWVLLGRNEGMEGVEQYLPRAMSKCHMYDSHLLNLTL